MPKEDAGLENGTEDAVQAENSKEIVVIEATDSSALKVPGGGWLLYAEFSHQGPDLLITGKNGEQVLVRDFFKSSNPPDLVTDGGLILKGEIAARLAGPLAPGQIAQAADGSPTEPIGRISTIDGDVEIERVDGTRVTVAEGDPVFQGDVVITGENGAIDIEFADFSTFSLGGDGRMVLDEMIYDPVAQEGEFALSVVSGTFSFISGNIAKTSPDAMVLDTPVATIGIRGTTVAGSVGGEGAENSISLLADPNGFIGEVVISNAAGTVVMSELGATVVMTSFNAPPPAPVILSPDEISQQYGAVVAGLVTPEAPGEEPEQQGEILTPEEIQTLGDLNQDIADAINQGIQQQQLFQQQFQQALGRVDKILEPKGPPPEVIQQFTQTVTAEILADAGDAVQVFISSAKSIAAASDTANKAEAEASKQLGAVTTSAKSSLGAAETGLTSTQAGNVAKVIAAPLDALNAAQAISAAASAMAKVNSAAARYAATKQEVPEAIQEALAVGSIVATAATNVRAIIDAVVASSPAVINAAVQAAKTNPNDAYNKARSTAASSQGAAIDAELAKAGAGITFADLKTILDGVANAVTTVNSLMSTAPAALRTAVTDTLAAAGNAVTAANESADAAYNTIAESDPDQVLSYAVAAGTKAKLAQTRLQDADDALTSYKLASADVVDASALNELSELDDVISAAEQGSVGASQSISSAQDLQEAASKFRSGEIAADIAEAKAARDGSGGISETAQSESQDASEAADAVLAARSVLVSKLVTAFVANATRDAWIDAVGEAQTLANDARDDVEQITAQTLGASNGSFGTVTVAGDGSVSYAADESDGSAFSLLGDNESYTDTFQIAVLNGDQDTAFTAYLEGDTVGAFTLQTITVTVTNSSGTPTYSDLSAVSVFGATQVGAAIQALSTESPSDQILEAEAALAGQRLQNLQSELDFQESVFTLFDDTLATAKVNRDDAKADAEAKQAEAYEAEIDVEGLVSASSGSSDGDIVLTSNIEGFEITVSVDSVDGGSDATNDINVGNSTPAETNVAQVDQVTLSGAVEVGDQFSVTIAGVTHDYSGGTVTVTAQDPNVAQVDALTVLDIDEASEIEAGDQYSVTVNAAEVHTATIGGTVEAGDVYTFTVKDHQEDGITISGTVEEGDIYSLTVSDFQEDTVTVSGAVEAGDVYSIEVGGVTASYVVSDTDVSVADIRDGLITAFDLASDTSTTVSVAEGSADGQLVITALQTGVEFTPVVSVTNVTDGDTTNQIDVATTTEASTTVTYEVASGDATLADVRLGLVGAIEGSAGVSAVVDVSNGAGDGDLTLKAVTPGIDFNSTVSVTNVTDGTNDNSIIVRTTTQPISETVSYTVKSGDTTVADVRAGLVDAINASLDVGSVIQAGYSGAANSFDIYVLDPAATLEIGAADVVNGDGNSEDDGTASVAVSTQQASVTVVTELDGNEADASAIRDAIVTALTGDAPMSALVTAADGSTGARLTLTSAVAGRGIETTTEVINGGEVVAGEISVSTSVEGEVNNLTLDVVRDALVTAINTTQDTAGLEGVFGAEFRESILATRALSDANAEVAKLEGFEALAQSAAQAEAQDIFDSVVSEALAQAEIAAARAEDAAEAAETAQFYARFPVDGVLLANKGLAEDAAIISGGASQEDTVRFSGTFSTGDIISIDLGDDGAATYQIASNIQTLADLEAALVDFINNDDTLSGTVEAIPEVEDGEDGVLKIRALERPGTFELTVDAFQADGTTPSETLLPPAPATSFSSTTTESQTGAEQAAEAAAAAAKAAAQNVATFAQDPDLSQDPAAVAARAKALASVQAAADQAAQSAVAAESSGNTAWAASDLADVINPTSHDPASLAAKLSAQQQAEAAAKAQEAANKAAAALAKQQAQDAEINKIVAELNALREANDAAEEAYEDHLEANGILTASTGSTDGKITLTSTIAGVELDGALSIDGSAAGALVNTTTQSSSEAQVDTVTLSGTPVVGDIFTLAVSVSQVDNVVITGTPEAGDTYTVTVNGVKITYETTGGEADLSGIRDGLVSAINAAGGGGAVTAAAGADSGELTLTANTSGLAFTSSAVATKAGGGVPDNFARSYTTVQNLESTSVTYTATGEEGGLVGVRDALIDVVNQSTALAGLRGAAAKAAADAEAAAIAAKQAELDDDADAANTAAANALTAAVAAKTAAAAAATAASDAQTSANTATAAAEGASAAAAREAERASNAAASAAQGSGAATNSSSNAEASFDLATAAANLQTAQDEAAAFAEKAAEDAQAAALQAREDAQAAADQAAADKAAAEDLALQQATEFTATAQAQSQLAKTLSTQAALAAKNVDQALAETLAEQAQAAADAAQAAANAAIDAALGKGSAALSKAREAVIYATGAKGFAGAAEAAADLAANASQAVLEWTSGDASADRLTAAKASAATAAAAARASDAAASAAKEAGDAVDSVCYAENCRSLGAGSCYVT